MLGLGSIIVLFATIIMAGVGLLSVLGFVRRMKEHPEKSYFYTCVLSSFTLGGVLLGFFTFAASVL